MASLFKTIYSSIGEKLRNGLHILRMQARLDEINHRAFVLQQEVEKLKNVIGMTNVLLSGINTSTHPLREESHGGNFEIYDIFEVINNGVDDTISMNVMVEYIEMNFPFKQNSFALIGGATHTLTSILQKKGAKKITDIRCRSIMGSKHSDSTFAAYPLELHTLPLPQIDVLIFPNAAIGSIAINHSLFNYGAKVHSVVLLVVNVMNDSIFSDEFKEKAYVTENRLVYSDNYIRQQIHASGFSEVRCIHTSGENINHSFDKKITHFKYKTSSESEFEIIKNSGPHQKKVPYNTHLPVKKIYVATKLPISIES